MALQLKTYKPGEGKNVRLGAFVFLSLFSAFGCVSLYRSVSTSWWETPIFGSSFLGEYGIKYGVVICALLFILCLFSIFVFIINNPTPANFLIETELELKKVSKPSKREYLGAAVAIIVMVILLGLYLTFVDQILALFVRAII